MSAYSSFRLRQGCGTSALKRQEIETLFMASLRGYVQKIFGGTSALKRQEIETPLPLDGPLTPRSALVGLPLLRGRKLKHLLTVKSWLSAGFGIFVVGLPLLRGRKLKLVWWTSRPCSLSTYAEWDFRSKKGGKSKPTKR